MNKFNGCITKSTLVMFFLVCSGISQTYNVLSQAEIDSGYALLFDGVTIDGEIWKQWDPKKAPLERNRYSVDATEQAMHKVGGYPNGDIMVDSIYADFVFKFQFKVSHQTGADNANSGIHYRAFDDEKWASASGIEYQIMDVNTSVNNATAAAYGVYAPDPYPWISGDWNTGVIIANGDDVEHYLNGVLVVKYNLSDADFLNRLGNSSFGSFSGLDPVDGRSVDFATSKRGWLILQDYGDLYDWWFRDIKITRLPVPVAPASGCTDPLAVNTTAGALQDDGSCSYSGCTNDAMANYFCTLSPAAFPCSQTAGYTLANITDDGNCSVPIASFQSQRRPQFKVKSQGNKTLILSGTVPNFKWTLHNLKRHVIKWDFQRDTKDVTVPLPNTGVYFVHFQAPGVSQVIKIVVLGGGN